LNLVASAAFALAVAGCGRAVPPIHLEERLAEARVTGSAKPTDLPPSLRWHGTDLAGSWRPAGSLDPRYSPPRLLADPESGLHMILGETERQRRGYRGSISVALPEGSRREAYSFVVVTARSSQPGSRLSLAFDRRRERGDLVFDTEPFELRGDGVDLVPDGAFHRYRLRADWVDSGLLAGPWRDFGLTFSSPEAATLDIAAVEVVPKEARFADASHGVTTEPRDEYHRRAIYVHSPSRLDFSLEIPRHARLSLGLGVVGGESVRFVVRAGEEVLLDDRWNDPARWALRSIDLGRFGGRSVSLRLETTAERAGAVALWAAPTIAVVSAAPATPNVILFVIDAGGAEYSSAYGYPRRTTPNLERLAERGTLFLNARSNSTWSKPSTESFMTSLQHSVLGGYGSPSEPLPLAAPTAAELLHRVGYQTAVFTSNTWCGTMTGLDRHVDIMQETIEVPNSASSGELLASFWRWRDEFPGAPYWVHFQTTDVHWPWEPVAPTAGTFLSPQARAAFTALEQKLGTAQGGIGRAWALRAPDALFERAGVDRRAYFEGARDAYDEALLYADYQLGELVAELERRDELDDTVLIVTADHGDWPGLGLLAGLDPEARVPMLNPFLTRVPLLVLAPGRVDAGRRVAEQVSLLDLLPTVLALTGVPSPPHLQGQSLVPLLTGEAGWQPRPVILDEFTRDLSTGELSGTIEIVDGQWGASLEIEPEGRNLWLCDLSADRYCLNDLSATEPDRARQYGERLEREFRRHRVLSKSFPLAPAGALEASQLEVLESLGYLR
jgi:arylsulfatase A-like enzyme